ncbi:MAG TPA: orotidine-5'-phosphate decarboxylase [Acidobacteriaceae bacterium]
MPPAFHSDARERLILALDLPSAAQAHALLAALGPSAAPRWVKVGLQLFLAEGPPVVHALREQGLSVFLDLKLHDIPNTVTSAIRALAGLQVEMLTVHAAGGPEMLAAAAEAAASLRRPPRLLAVTVLTSMDAAQLASSGIDRTPQQQVLQLAHLARSCGIHGLVASPLEAALLRSQADGHALHIVTPGIRPALSAQDDQQRVATPGAALVAGADQLVVGRPITRAADPAAAFRALLAEIETAVEAQGRQQKEPVSRTPELT